MDNMGMMATAPSCSAAGVLSSPVRRRQLLPKDAGSPVRRTLGSPSMHVDSPLRHTQSPPSLLETHMRPAEEAPGVCPYLHQLHPVEEAPVGRPLVEQSCAPLGWHDSTGEGRELFPPKPEALSTISSAGEPLDDCHATGSSDAAVSEPGSPCKEDEPVQSQQGTQLTPRMQFCLGGDMLELVMAPGDVLVVRGGGRLAELGNAGGVMGHVLVVVAPPVKVLQCSPEAAELQGVWPMDDITEIWRVRTMESTRRESGLYESEMLLFVVRQSRHLKLFGEIDPQGEVHGSEHEVVELWQSPGELRAELRYGIMMEVLAEMRANQANWSVATAARALLKAAAVNVRTGATETLAEIQSFWEQPPICTSVVITFWQRYFSKLAAVLDVGGMGPFAVGERVEYWSNSFQRWIDTKVLAQCTDAQGIVVSYDLEVKGGAIAANMRRPMMEASDDREMANKAVALIMRYMPLKADRALPGDLLQSIRTGRCR